MGEIKPLAGRIEAFATHCRIGRRSKKLRTQPRDGHVATSLPWSCAGVSIAPQRGASRSPKASGPRLWRSPAGGLRPQTPRAAPPVRPSAHGPRLSCLPVWKEIQKLVGQPERGQRSCPPEGVSPCSGGGGQTPAPPIGRLSTFGGQRGCPRPERTTGRSLERYLRVTVFCDLAENEYWRGFPADFGLFSWDHF